MEIYQNKERKKYKYQNNYLLTGAANCFQYGFTWALGASWKLHESDICHFVGNLTDLPSPQQLTRDVLPLQQP